MKSLNVEIHPDKTWLGRVKNGFDFLGFRMSPTTIQPSTESVSRRDKKIARLYEQGASTKRIGQYLRRWLGWSIVSCTAWSSAYAAPAASCNVTITGGTFVSLALSSSTGAATATLQVTEGAIGTTFNSLGPHCLTASPPDGDPSICDADPVQIIDGSPFYVTSYIPATDEYCEYTVTVSAAGSSAVNSIARSVPTAVPIFSPFGLLVMSGALIWYGRRRQATVLVKN